MRIEPLTHEMYPPKYSPKSLQRPEPEPEVLHVKLARIIATNQSQNPTNIRRMPTSMIQS